MVSSSAAAICSFSVFLVLFVSRGVGSAHNYRDALSKSIMFFEGQRSGRLPAGQRMRWRRDSALKDGLAAGVDLVGGYYDAGDNVKFGFPMAFTTTMIAWSIVEFQNEMIHSGELHNALIALRWATDYLLKAVAQPNRIFVQVGDALADHNCWERPEDMDTPRSVYSVEQQHPGSEIAGEMAAAMAAASMAFRSAHRSYADTLLANAIRVFEFADTYRGSYSDNPVIREAVCPCYCDFSGYQDELLWGAAWLLKATANDSYLDYIQANGKMMGAGSSIYEFGWDNKQAGTNVLLSKEYLDRNVTSLQSYKGWAGSLVCSLAPGPMQDRAEYTPGGLLYRPNYSNMQHVTSLAFLLLAHANYLEAHAQDVYCGGTLTANAHTLRRQAKKQVDYLLGDNPMGMSYMVGYGHKFPQRIHHRGSSLPSVAVHTPSIPCEGGTVYFNSRAPNPNHLTGAVVGGPDQNDVYDDDRADFRQSQPTTYINAPLVGVLAYFAANPN